jgi:DNA polymerase-3 subunit alpha
MQFFVPPLIDAVETPGEMRMVKVILRTTGDKRRDVLRLRRVHGILRSAHGRDKFALLVFESGSRYLVEFPNDTTGITPDLLQALTTVVGEGNVLVETIKLQ